VADEDNHKDCGEELCLRIRQASAIRITLARTFLEGAPLLAGARHHELEHMQEPAVSFHPAATNVMGSWPLWTRMHLGTETQKRRPLIENLLLYREAPQGFDEWISTGGRGTGDREVGHRGGFSAGGGRTGLLTP
jgi:hypothetical protein